MRRLLTLKHWQLFLLMIGVPIAAQFIAIGTVISGTNPNTLFFFIPVMMILFMTLFFGWFYTLGTNLHKKLPEDVKMNLTRFKIFLFIPVVYILLVPVFMLGMFSSGGQPNPAILLFILPMHLFSMFCIFYCLYFIAKVFKSVEWQKPVTFSDYAGEFFLIWFFPFGIWIIQPRINKLFDPSIGDENNQILDSNV